MTATAKLTTGSIRGHLVSQTAPMIIGVAAIMSVGLVDSYFIGQLGAKELAAVSFIFPVGVALGSLGVGVMVGINSVVARALGAGDSEMAHRRAVFGQVFSVVLGIAMGLALYALIDPIFRLMQAPPDQMPLIRSYMVPFALGYPLQMAIMGINGTMRGQGEARKTSLVSITYASANWVLDPILITGAFGIGGFGVAGAAYATLIGWTIAIALGQFLLTKTGLPFDPAKLREGSWLDPAKTILRVAGPAAFSNAINPIGLAVLTALIASQGQAAVAGFGAGGRLMSFAVVPLLGLSGSIGAIVGQNWGARQAERSRSAMLQAGIFAVFYGLAMGALLAWQGEWFGSFFSDDPAVVREIATYLSIAAWGYAGFGVLITSNGALNAVDKAGWALAQSFARVFLVMLPFAWLLRGSWGEEAIYGAELAANLIGGAVAALVVWRVLRKGPVT